MTNSMDASQIGKRAWSYAGVLQDAGLSCFEYVEQLTLLLFLKMADQLTAPPYERAPLVPAELGWQALLKLDGAALEDQYRRSLERLASEPGMLGAVFKGARCEIHNPTLLKQLIVNLLDRVDWLSLPVDVKGTIYEELLSRSAQESSRGAGQYFTPRPVIEAMPVHVCRNFTCSLPMTDREGLKPLPEEARTRPVDSSTPSAGVGATGSGRPTPGGRRRRIRTTGSSCRCSRGRSRRRVGRRW